MRSRAVPASMFAAFVVFTSPAVRAQTAAQAAPHAQLPAVPSLRLSWPIAPLSFTIRDQSVSLLGLPSLPLYEAESLWLHRGPVMLLTFGSTALAPELDCRLTCQPVLQRSAGVEARFSLPVVVPRLGDPHAFLRYSGYQTSLSPRAGGLVHAGLAGAFDF